MITLTNFNTSAVLTLPPHLDWPDEFGWSPVAMRTERTLTGALHIQTGVKQAGRPITLKGARDSGWITRADLLTLRGWFDTPLLQMTLALRGTNYNVRADHQQNALEAEQVAGYSDPDATDFYIPTIRFITV